MTGLIYLRQFDGTLVGMTEQPYDTEEVLQRLLADYPSLLAGEQVNTAAPRRWLLVSRETSLPSEEGGASRWSVDHLFLDQAGILTIVEVRRSSDTRIRREVIGQMLEYAANAVVYWPVETLRAQFEAHCEAVGNDPNERIAEALDHDDPEALWQMVQTNLQVGRVRLVFVADSIPPELRRIIEFLNGQMNPAEVIGVEVKQYVGQGQQALVPRVVGQTQQAAAQKAIGGSSSRQWDEPSFLTELEVWTNPEGAIVAKQTLDWAVRYNLRIRWGKGLTEGSMCPLLEHQNGSNYLFAMTTPGRVSIQFANLMKSSGFEDESARLELLHKLNAIQGIQIPEDRITRYPSFPLAVLTQPGALEAFLFIFDWVIHKILHSEATGSDRSLGAT